MAVATLSPGQRRERRCQGGPEVEIVVDGHGVERRAHQRRLDDESLRECAVQRRRVEGRQAGPEREVRRSRLLRLEPTERLDRIDRLEGDRFEEVLAGERRPVQAIAREDRVAMAGHRCHGRASVGRTLGTRVPPRAERSVPGTLAS
jgi:hypothetical protein